MQTKESLVADHVGGAAVSYANYVGGSADNKPTSTLEGGPGYCERGS